MTDLETREATLEYREADDTGYLEGIAVPWGQTVSIGGRFNETFERGSVESEGTVWLYRDHKHPIGEVIESEDREEGFWIRARIALSDLANETRSLLREGALRALSVGFVPIASRDEAGVIVRTRTRLREVSVVNRPAYSQATVLAVRESEPTPTNKESNMTDPVNADVANELRSAIEDIDRRLETIDVNTRAVEAPAVETRSAGELVKAAVEGDESAIEVLNRDYAGAVQADGYNKPEGLIDLRRIFDASTGLLGEVFSRGTVPATGNTVEYIEIDANTLTFTEQVAEGDDIPMGKVSFKTRTAPIKTYAGGADLSRQAIERSTVSVLSSTLEGLAIAAGARKKAVLRTAYNAAVTARSGIAANGGVVVLGATLAASTAGNWEDALIDASLKYEAMNLRPEALIVSASVFKKLRSLTVSGERAFTVTEKNASGALSLLGLSGSFAGLPVYLDSGATGDSAVFVNARAIKQFDSALVSLSDEKISNLTKQFAVYSYGAIGTELAEAVVPVKLSA